MGKIIEEQDKMSDIQASALLPEERLQHKRAFLEHGGIVTKSFEKDACEIKVPAIQNYPRGFTILLGKVSCPYKRLLFKALNAAHHRIFSSDDFAESRKNSFAFAAQFWNFAKEEKVTNENKVNILKNFEAFRVASGVKTQSTGLGAVIVLLKTAIQFGEFSKTLDGWQIDFLYMLSKTNVAPFDEKDPISLNEWFSSHSWLRREDIGIGNDLYKRLSSPKALIGSFRISIECALSQIQTSKDALVEFFIKANITEADFPERQVIDKSKLTRGQISSIKRSEKLNFLNMIAEKLPNKEDCSKELYSAIVLLVYSNVRREFREKALVNIFNNNVAQKGMHDRGSIALDSPQHIFDFEFVIQLSRFSHARNGEAPFMPVCEAEELFFSWLMAYQTVQPSDISKLTLSDFKFVSRIDGRITHIESDYFKGRAGAIKRLKILKTSEILGGVILRYIKDVTKLEERSKSLVPKLKIAYGMGKDCYVARCLLFCEEECVQVFIKSRLEAESLTSVFLSAFSALTKNGQRERKNRTFANCDTITKATTFHLTHIKNSSVYSQSDLFKPTTLLNYNSHLDDTEEKSYLTEHNEEWCNNCGRVTRAVMRDFTVNLFRASKRDRQLFNSEFTRAGNIIESRAHEMKAVMKLVTGQSDGQVNELGILKRPTLIDDDLPDAVYIENSANTVLRLLHYIQQVEEKYNTLKYSSPEFLLFTVLPTTEWIECLFADKAFDKETLFHGKTLYQKYKDVLPPLFNNQES